MGRGVWDSAHLPGGRDGSLCVRQVLSLPGGRHRLAYPCHNVRISCGDGWDGPLGALSDRRNHLLVGGRVPPATAPGPEHKSKALPPARSLSAMIFVFVADTAAPRTNMYTSFRPLPGFLLVRWSPPSPRTPSATPLKQSVRLSGTTL
jgi:hypothetical protein